MEKISKDRLSILLCASMTCEKRQAFRIGKYLRPRCFKNKNLEKIKYYANKNAWMTSEIFKIEIMKWDSELRRDLRNIILLIDNCSAHPNINEFLTNIKLVFLPPNTTSILQPMDSGVILNFKVNYRKLLVMEMIRCCDLNLDFKINVFQAIQMIEDSWSTVLEKTIINCFNHAIGYDSDTKEENAQSEPFVDQLVETELCEFLNFFKTKGALTDYILIDKEVETTGVYDDNENITATTNKCEKEFKEREEIKIEDALTSLKIVKDFYYGETNNTVMYKSLLEMEKDLQYKYLTRKSRQNKITDYFMQK